MKEAAGQSFFSMVEQVGILTEMRVKPIYGGGNSA